LTRGRAATPDPFDLTAVSSSDELFDALSSRRLADLNTEGGDPAAALLAALVADVDVDAPPLPAPARVACGIQSSCRRGVRAFVTFGVAAVVLTSAGAAAAGGPGDNSALGGAQGSNRPSGTERSNENVQHQDHITGTTFSGGRPPVRRLVNKHRNPTPEEEQVPAAEDELNDAPDDWPQWSHHKHRQRWGRKHSPSDIHHPPILPGTHSSPGEPTPTPTASTSPPTS
jgi:hypothetical protein